MKRSSRVLPTLLLFVCCIFTSAAQAQDWSQFRGPDGNGISTDKNIPTEWTAEKNVAWKLDMPGAGFSSPIVVGDYVFVTCYTGGGRNVSNLKRQLVCVDRKKGSQVWVKTIDAVTPEFTERGNFSHHGYASSTPVSDGERIYVLFGTTGLIAFDMKGDQLWQKKLGTELRARFGSASSPLLYKDLVIVMAANESETIYAFNKKTGKEEWKTPAGLLSTSYSTPMITKNRKGEDELLVFVANEVWGLNPMTGKLIWYAECTAGGNVCSSLVTDGEGTVYAIGGGGQGRPGRSKIEVGGKDDVTKTNVKWTTGGAPYVPSPVLYKDHLYYVTDRGIATCIDAKTGKEVGTKRLGGQFYASVTLINDKLYAVSRFGGTYVLEADPKMTQVALNKLGDTSDFSGSPAISNGQLFIRSDKCLYCIKK